LGRTREINSPDWGALSKKNKAFISFISMAAGGADLQDTPVLIDSNAFYTLTPEEVGALVNGNLETIESRVDAVDKRLATRLFSLAATG